MKRIKPRVKLIEHHSQTNIKNLKQYPTKKLFLSENGKIKRDINNILEGNNDLYFQKMDSSLKDSFNTKETKEKYINAYDYYPRIQNNSYENYTEQNIKEIPIRNNYNQTVLVNPLNKIEYLNNSSQTIGTNSFPLNQNSDKYSNSLIMIDSINNNMNNYNEIEANSDKERENSFKIRYHRAKRYSPFYKNNFGKNNIYNRLNDPERDYDINNNNMRTYHNQRKIIDINELAEINQINTDNNINNNYNEKQFLYSSDDGVQESPKNEDNNKKINYCKKKLVRKFTDIYDPSKNKKGILLPRAKMTFSLSSSPLPLEKRRNFSKNSKLSDLIMNNPKKLSPDNIKFQTNEEFYSGSEDRTTCQNDTKKREKKIFDRRSFEKYQQSKTLIRLNKSPQERFRNITLAMISSKGKNTENRSILTNMRFERGGVVDLAQNERKKNKYKYLIRKIKRPQIDDLIHNNPKYREKAANLIKEWWKAIKEYNKKRNESAILIQSYFRGRFVRKYLYDVIYMNYIYFGFCKKIEKFIIKKYGPYFFDTLINKFIKQRNDQKNLALLYILRIRAIRESKMFNLKRVFSKWNYISIIKKERTNNKNLQKERKGLLDYKDEEIENEINRIEKNKINKDKKDNENDINKIQGLFKIINGTEKYMKKKAMDMASYPIKYYLNELIIKNRLSKLKEDKEELIKIKMELFIKKLEPFLYPNKELYGLFIKLIASKIKKRERKYKNKSKGKEGNDDNDYIYTKEYNKTIKKKKIKEYDIMDSDEEEESEVNIEKDDNNTKIEKIKKYYILKNLLKIKKLLNTNKMRKYFNIWKKGNNKINKPLNDKNYIQNLIKLQSMSRQILSKNKLEKLRNLNNILEKFINRKIANRNSILLFYLRKWNSNIKQISCINQIKLIQKCFRKFLYNKNMNKLRTFLFDAYKNYVLNNLGKISKMIRLKSIFKNISKRRIESKIKRIRTNKRISKLLVKIINNDESIYNDDLKKYYLNKWKNRKNIIKNKDNRRKKLLLMKIFNKKDNLKKLLKLYFLRWQRNHNLLLINEAVIILQRNWRRKIISDIKNKRNKENIIFLKKIADKINKKKKEYYISFFDKIKKLNRKFVLSKLEETFANKRINILKDVINKIDLYIKNKYILKILSISDNSKKRLLRKYIKIWKNKSDNNNKKLSCLRKYINKKEFINKGLKLSYIYKWLYHTKLNNMKNNIKVIQNEYRNYRINKSAKNNWDKIIKALLNKENKKEIKDIIRNLKILSYFNKIKKSIRKKSGKNIIKDFKKFNKDSLIKLKMRDIIINLNEKKNPLLLRKYFTLWNNNINKEIEREKKLDDLLYTIEKRMNINSVRILYKVSLIKNICDIYTKFRKYQYFKKLVKYSQKKKYISDFSNNLSSAYDDIKSEAKRNIITKIFKYFVYIKLVKLLDNIRINRNKEVKQYKIKLINYLKHKEKDFSSSEKRNKKNSYQFMSPKQKKKVDNTKKLDKYTTKSQSIINISNKKNKNYKEKEKEKEIMKKKIVKGFSNKKKGNRNSKLYEKDRYTEDKISRSESEYESENNQIKENLNAIYEPLLGELKKVINKIIIRKKKEYLLMIKENTKIIKEEKEKERVFYIHKLYKTLRSITIKKLFIEKNELLRAKRLINLIKLTRINSQISTDRWIRQIIRRWRFISFVKLMSKKKLELMYKNLHVGYLEIINSLFNNKENQFPSIIKEFENFGSNIGMYKNSDILKKEKDLYLRVKKKYISKPIEYDIQNLKNIESGKFINELKYKSDEEQGDDSNYIDSDKDVVNKIKNRIRRNVNYDRDKP